jgi:subtilisin family serine protease
MPVQMRPFLVAIAFGAAVAPLLGGGNAAPNRTEARVSTGVAKRLAAASPLPDQPGGWSTTRVIVRIQPGIAPVAIASGRPSLAPAAGPDTRTVALADTLSRFGATSIEQLFPGTRADPARAAALGLDRTFAILLPAGSDTPGLVAALAGHRDLVERAELDGIGGLAEVPNDPQFFLQYPLQNTGQVIQGVTGTPGADIDMVAAWDIAPSASQVTIAFLDSGMNVHVELAARMLPGWNIPANSANTSDNCSSHGTHVAGIAAATRGNATGIAGVCDAKLVPYVVVNPCSGSESWVATALVRAVDDGHRLVNMSLQYYSGTTALRDAVLYAYGLDTVMVAAAGNNGSASVAFPARWPETIAVAGLTNTGARWTQSNYGAEIDLAAPAFAVQSTVDYSGYNVKSGTSQAAPHVSGVVALMLAKNPSLTPAQVREILVASATDIGTPGFDPQTGFGRLDAHAALVATPPPSVPGDLDGNGTVDATDLAIMLGAWGACADCEACPADLDGNCTVDAADLASLLGAWS